MAMPATMNFLGKLALGTLKGYRRIAPTERGGYRLVRLARRFVPRGEWQNTYRTPDRLTLRLDLGTYPDCCMAVGLYELDTHRRLRRILKPGSHFADVGANIGYFTTIAAQLVGPTGRVDAFEPDPINRQRLQEHLAANRLAECVRVHPVGAGAEPGRVTLYHPKTDSGNNHGSASIFQSVVGESEPFTIDIVRVDEALDRVPDLIKMDIEGAELSAIQGMTKLLQSERPPKLIIEHNHETTRAAGHTMADIFRTLTQAQPKYKVYWIGTRLTEVPTAEALQAMPRQGNILVSVD